MPQAFSMSFDASKLIAALQRAPTEVSKELRIELSQGLRTVVQDARANHRFIKHSGHLQKSLSYEVSPSGLEGKVFIEKSVAPYGGWVHDGHKIKPKQQTSNRKTSYGRIKIKFARLTAGGSVPADTFVYDAMKRQMQFIFSRLRGAVSRAYQIAGLQ